MNTVVPLSPSEVDKNRGDHVPDIVITAVNTLLKKHYDGRCAIFCQDDVIDEIKELDPSVTREKIFGDRWLDFEPLFEKVGWKIEYDKPGYNESYSANFTFRKRTSPQRD